MPDPKDKPKSIFDGAKSLTIVNSDNSPSREAIEAGITDSGQKSTFGKSKFDLSETTSSALQSGEYNYYRGERQDNWDKAANGLIRFVGKTPARFAEGVINPFLGTASAIFNQDASKLWDNEITKGVNQFGEYLDEQAPLYQTRSAENAHGFAKLAKANTWFGDILDGVSYSVAAMGSGNVNTKMLTSIMSKAASVGKLNQVMGKVTQAMADGDPIKLVNIESSLKSIKDGVKMGTFGVMSATTEAADNALSDSKEFAKNMEYQVTHDMFGNKTHDLTEEERQHIDKLRKELGNTSFALNIPVITADNLLMFGKAMLGKSTEKAALSEVAGLVEKGSDNVYKAAKKDAIQSFLDKTYGIRKVSSGMLSEGGQETSQLGITKGTQDYYTKKYYNPSTDDFMSSFKKGIEGAFSEEGFDNFLIGAISGGLVSTVTSLKTEGVSGFKSPTDGLVNEAINILNSRQSTPAYKAMVDAAMRHANLTEEQIKAAKNNDDFEYQNKQADIFLNYVTSRIKTGKIQDLKDDLESFRGLAPEEFEKSFDTKLSTNELTGLKESVSSFVENKLKKVAKVEKLHESLENLVPNASESAKDRLLYAAFTLENTKERRKQLDNEITSILSNNIINNPGLHSILSNPYSSFTNDTGKEQFRGALKDSEVTPIDQEEIKHKINDFDKLKSREEQFLKEYRELLKPEVQAANEVKDKEVEKKVNDIHNAKPSSTDVANKLTEGQELSEADIEALKHQDGFYDEVNTKVSDKVDPKRDTDNFHIVLHGDTRDNEKGLSRSDDSQLDYNGQQEALRNKERLIGQVNNIVSSPLDRAQHTSTILTDSNEFGTHNGLATWDIGTLKGKPESEFNEKYFVEHPDEKVGDAESFNDFKYRTLDAIKELANKSGGNNAIVTHSKVEALLKAWEAKGFNNDYNIDENVYLNYKEDRSKPTTFNRGQLKGNNLVKREGEVKESIIENTEDGIYIPMSKAERIKLEEALNKELDYQAEDERKYSPQGKVVTVGDLIVPAAHSIAYLSREYNQQIATKAGKTYRKKVDKDEALNANMQEPLLLSPNEYQPGTELFIEVDTAFNLVLDDNTTITYNTYKDDALRVPMKITNKDGKTIGYLHTIDWVNENNVASKNNNIEEQRKLLTELRYKVNESKLPVTIDTKSIGKISKTVNNENKPTSEVIKNPKVKFVIAKGNDLLTGIDEVLTGEQPINKTIKPGVTYMLADTPVKGKTVAIPVFNNKLNEQVVNTLTNATEAFFKQDPKVADEVYKHTAIDILTANGLRQFFNLFVATNSFDKGDVNISKENRIFLDVSGNGIKIAKAGGRIFDLGSTEYWTNHRSDFENTLRDAYTSIFLKHLNKDSFKYAYIANDGSVSPYETTYTQFIKDNTTSNVIDHELPNGEYTSFVQPVITFTTESVPSTKEGIPVQSKTIVEDAEELGDNPDFGLGTIDFGSVDTEDFSPKTFNPEALKESTSLIDGFSAFKQDQVITIMNSYILKNIKEGSKSKDELYENLKNIFGKYSKASKIKNPSISSEFDKIISNFDTFRSLSEEALKRFNVTETEGVVGIEDVESNNEKTNFDDGATFQIDSKDGMSGRLKQFLSFIPSTKRSYLGLETYMPYDEVVNYLSGQLAGLDASYEDISAKLDELKTNVSWISSVKDLLDNAEPKVRDEFVVWATKHYAGFKIVNLIDGKDGITMKVMDADQNSVTKLIQAKWYTNLKTSDLVYEKKPGELAINSAKRDELLKEFNDIVKTDLNAIRAWLSKLGIDISLDALEALKSNRRLSIEQQFTDASGIFKVLKDELAKANLDEDDSFESNNPMLNNSGIRTLAQLESKHTEGYFSNSHKNGEGKTIFSYSPNKYFIKQFYRLKHNKANYLTDLLSTSFASTSAWGKKLLNPNSYHSQVFDYFYIDSIKVGNKAVKIDQMSDREHEVYKLAAFQNQMNGSKDRGYISHFILPTMSDKSTMTGLTAVRHNTGIRFNQDGSYDISSDTIDELYNIVEAEYNRIRSSYNIDNQVDGYSPNRFYFFPELNENTSLWDSEGNKSTLKPLDNTIKDIIRSTVSNHLKQLIEAKKADWRDLGITKDNDIKYFDKSYISAVKATLSKANNNNSNIITSSAADYVTNYLIANANVFQLFIGDPALFWKKNMEETWINIGKRNAGEIAPGLELADSKDNKYTQAFIKDASGVLSVSKNYKQIESLIGKEAAKPYREIEGTDAQEYTTLKEHLYVLNKLGRLDEAKMNELLDKESKGKLDKHDFETIFQPIKPVYVYSLIDKGMDINRKMYIKSSSFPLVKGLSPELDKLRDAMIKQGVDRVAYKTATKVGGPKTFDNIFTEEGKISDNIEFKNTMVLDRAGFRIQQEVPFDETKKAINRGTQESKLLFANILGLKNIEHNGNKLTGEQLYHEYNQLNKELFSKAKEALLKEITKDGGVDLVKVADILAKEAKGRGWSQNDIDALKLIPKDIGHIFDIPLWSSSSANKIEALLSSIVDNRVRKQKFRGNSFVLGSEEGFIGNSKDIIYTNNYNPETGLLPQRIENGIVKPAQILISNKLRGKDGELIDLSKGLDNIDPEVLKVFGFRIPTQGHNSMTYAEVVGFLPSYMGDLVIAPKDYTKQMGSDFDVDKLYTYFYNTEFKDGKLVKVENDIQNKLLDIHISVMSNPTVLEQVLQPLGFGKLKDDTGGLAKKIDKARSERLSKDFKPTKLSDTYQRDKYMKARGGKSGTGTKSLDSVFTVISQGKGLYFRQIEGETETPINIVFGDENGKAISLNNISSEEAYDKTPKLNVVAAYQSAAVDNEKEQILEKINSNDYTFDAERALAAVGFTEDFIAPLTAQDIIFEYVDMMSKMQDTLNEEFISRPENTIVEQLIDKYAKEGGLSKEVLDSVNDKDYPLTQKEMWDSISKGKEDPNFYKTQIRALVKFNHARELGKTISDIQLAINTDSSGIPSSLIESNYKEIKVDKVVDNALVANVGALLADTINGYATDDALRTNNELWSGLFPYKSNMLNNIFDEVQRVTGKEVLTSEARQKLFSDIKSYVYSGNIHTIDNQDVNELRQKLFFDSKTNKSLATRVKELQAKSNNPFIKRLIPEPDITGKKPSLIKYNAAASENYDELSIHQGFADLLLNDSTKELGQDLVTYFYLSGGIQQAIQFGKYIPVAYLTSTDFSKGLRSVNFNDETTLGNSTYKRTGREVSTFTKQWLQHNPNQAIKLKDDLSQVNGNKVGDTFTLNTEASKDLQVKRQLSDGTFITTYPEFLAHYNPESPKKFDLYEYQGDSKYVKIDTLGSFGYSEYTQGSDNRSLIDGNKSKARVTQPVVKTDVRDNIEKKSEEKIDNNQPKIDRANQYKVNEGINSVLNTIKGSTNELHKLLANTFSGKSIGHITIKVDTNLQAKGSYNYDSNTIRINPKYITSDVEFERVVLHELIHGLTGNVIKSDKRTAEQDRVVKSLEILQKQLIKKIESNPTWKAEYDKFVKDYESRQRLDEYQVSKNYGAYKLTEFVTMAMTDMEFQKILNEIPFDGSKSMWDRFKDLITKLLGTLGFEVKTGSVLEQAIGNTIELINLSNSDYVEDVVEEANLSNLLTFTNYSGGAKGGDTYWETIGKKYGLGKQVNYRPEDLNRLKLEQKTEVELAYLRAVKDLGRKPLEASSFAGGLVRRDYLQAKKADAVYAISTIVKSGEKDPKGYTNKTNKDIVAGGTGYAVQMAINLGKPVFVFDQNKEKWFKFEYQQDIFGKTSEGGKFIETETPTLVNNFAGIGTREINEAGIKAIEDVYKKTLKNIDLSPTTEESIRANVREGIRKRILELFNIEGTSAYRIEGKPNSIMLPVNPDKPSLSTKANTYNWAKSVVAKIDKEFNTKTYGELVQIDPSNPKGTLVHILFPSALTTHLMKSNEDYTPRTTSKYQSEIDKFKERIGVISKRIASGKADREIVTKLKAKKEELESRIEALESDERLADLVNYGNVDMKDARKLLSSDKISLMDLQYVDKIIRQWENNSNGLLSSLFSESEREKVDGEYSPNVQAIKDIIDEAQNLRMLHTKAFENAAIEMFKSQGVNATKEQIFAAKKEISALTANLMDSSRVSDLLSQVTSKIIREANYAAEQEVISEFNTLDELYNKVSKTSEFKSKGWNLFAQESKDGKTGNLVTRFSQEFYEANKKQRAEAHKNKDWGKYFEWKRANNIVFDLRKIFNEEYQSIDGKHKFSKEAIESHISDLKAQLGEKGYQEYESRLKDKLELYKQDLEAYKGYLDTLEVDDASRSMMEEEWVIKNSPFVYAESINEGTKFKIAGKFANLQGFKYTSEVPRRYTKSGQSTGWYDSKFDTIEANEDLFAFYKHIMSTFNDMKEFMPEYVVDELQYNYLPEIRKNIVELFKDNGMNKGLTGWYDKVVAELTTDDISNISYAERDPVTGAPIKSLPISMMGNKLSADEKSYDLLKVAKAFSSMALAYKHKSVIEDSVRLAEQVMNTSLEKQENAQGEHLLDALGRPINTTDALKNLKAQFEYLVDAGFYGNRKDVEGVSKKKLYKSDEKKTKKEIETQLKDPNLTEGDRAELLAQLNELGSNVVGSSVFDKVLQFVQLKGMGWNLFAPSNNIVFGFVSNLNHAAGGEDFDIPTFMKAQGTMLHSVGKSVSLDSVKTKTANKISKLMEKFNVVGEIDQAGYKSTAMNSGAAKGLQKLSPMELTRRAEYLNQGSTFIALLMGTKQETIDGLTMTMWDAYEDGVWNEAKFGPEPKEKIKALKFKLEQLKKTIHGNYDPNSPTRIKKHALGRALLMFRSWVAEGFAQRFEAQKHDILLGRDRKGRYRTWNPLTGGELGYASGATMLLSQMANFLTFGTTFKTSLDQLSPVDKANMRKNAAEVLTYLSLYTLVLMLKGFDSDDDKEKKSINALLNISFRVQNDMAFFTSPLAFEKITQSSIPAMTIITDAAKLVKAMEDQIVGKGEYQKGYYKGQSKVKIALAKQFPGTAQVIRTLAGLEKASE